MDQGIPARSQLEAASGQQKIEKRFGKESAVSAYPLNGLVPPGYHDAGLTTKAQYTNSRT